MSGNHTTHDDSRKSSVEKLDILIEAFYTHIEGKIEEYAKLGDLLKMIELKNKLLPDNSNQKEFWKMMEQIRKRKLPGKEKPAANNPSGNKRSRTA